MRWVWWIIGTGLTGASLALLADQVFPGEIARYRHPPQHLEVFLPDARVTPGDVMTTDTKTICTTGYAKTVRHVPPKLADQVYAQYRQTRWKGICKDGCEVDHLISLELGGSNDLKNLWPQPYEPRPGAHEKDTVENVLHATVCAGKMTLQNAQQQIATNWYKVYGGIQARKQK